MDLVYVVGFHWLLAAATGNADNFVATVYGPLPVRDAMALVSGRNGGGDGLRMDWTWRIAPPNSEYPEGSEPPLQALEDSAVIQFKTLGNQTLRSINCVPTDSSGMGNLISMTYTCNQFGIQHRKSIPR